MADYEFRYAPLTGRLTGKQMIEQTEQAINGLAGLVDEAAGQVEIISTLANEANENAATALETAEEALATTGRTYITVSIPANANDYFDSQLIYIADSTSTNIPVADTGMLEVKTNDDKTACEQVFIADSSGESYYRHGDITAETVGDVTTYTVTWGGWSSQPATQAYVQGELANYLPLSGGTMTGGITLDASNNINSIQCSNMSSLLYVWGGGSGSSLSGSTLILSGINSTVAGKFYLRSPIDSSNFMQLEGNGATGSLQWNSKEVERVNATSTNYIRYESGLQLCWGTLSSVNSSGVSVTFPVAFNATPAIMLSTTASSHCYYSGGGSTGFTAKSAASSATVIYVAVGYWK